MTFLESRFKFLDGRLFQDQESYKARFRQTSVLPRTFFWLIANPQGEFMISQRRGVSSSVWHKYKIDEIKRNGELFSMKGSIGDFEINFHVHESGRSMTYTTKDDQKPDFDFNGFRIVRSMDLENFSEFVKPYKGVEVNRWDAKF